MDAGDEEQEVIGTLSVIAQPLAGKKLTKKLLKVVKKAAASKILRRGVKEVVKVLRKADGKFKGLVIIAGDLSPIDVISHLPVLCEDHSVPYAFVSSKLALGTAAATKRPTSCVLIPVGVSKAGKGGEEWDSEDKLVEAVGEVVELAPTR